MEDDDHESFLHYIHRWHDPEAPEDVAIGVADMEAHIMRALGEEAQRMRDPVDPGMAAFYHDNWDGGRLKIATGESFSDQSHLGVRRVLGCGHFVLCLLYMTLNCMEVQEGAAWPYARFWPLMRENLRSTGLLKREATCKAAGVYRWMQGFLFKKIFERIEDSDPYKEIVRTPLTKLRVQSSPCNPTVDETTEKFKRNYNEFLVLHLYVMDEMQMLESEPHRDQYLKLLRRRSKAVSGWTRPVIDQKFIERGGSLRAALSSRRRQKLQMQDPQQPPESQKSLQPNESTEPQQLQESQESQEQEKGEAALTSESKASMGAGQAKVRDAEGFISFPKPSRSWRPRRDPSDDRSVYRYRWHRSANFRPANGWSRPPRSWSTGIDIRIRVVDHHWRLGCLGCKPGLLVTRRLPAPRARQRRWLRQRRYCKWITVKRTVLVRRR